MRDSIGWTWGELPAGSLSIGTFRNNDYGKIAITVYAGGKGVDGADAYYARFVEFGTITMGAQPFFYPTVRAMKKSNENALCGAVRKALKGA